MQSRTFMPCHDTRWITGLPSKVNLPGVIDSHAKCGANMVTLPADIRGNEMCVVHRVVGRWFYARIPSTLPYYKQNPSVL